MNRILQYILIQILFFSCKTDQIKTNSERVNKIDHVDTSVSSKIDFNVFVENSGSMDGYISQPSEFKDVIRSFTSDIPTYFNTNPGFYFVNSNGTFEALPKHSTPN